MEEISIGSIKWDGSDFTICSCLNKSSPEANSICQNLSYPISCERVIETLCLIVLILLLQKDRSYMGNVIALRAVSSINLAKWELSECLLGVLVLLQCSRCVMQVQCFMYFQIWQTFFYFFLFDVLYCIIFSFCALGCSSYTRKPERQHQGASHLC